MTLDDLNHREQQEAPDLTVIRGLRVEVEQLVHRVRGPLTHMSASVGACRIDLTWAPSSSDAPGEDAPADGPPTGGEDRDGLVTVTAPLVGRFYRCPSPGEAPFVEVDDQVTEGDRVGIVEAMKLMNHILSEHTGRVVAVHPEDGAMVEFGEPLLDIAVETS